MTLLYNLTIPSYPKGFEAIQENACKVLAQTHNTLINQNNNIYFFIVITLCVSMFLLMLIFYELRQIRRLKNG